MSTTTTTSRPTQFPPKSIQNATFLMRLLTFIAALGMFGTFFLPWIMLDGHDSPSTGVQLITTILSPEFNYLTAVSTPAAFAVVGCPFLAFVCVAIVCIKKFQRETSPVATIAILVLAGALVYYPTALTGPASEPTYIGLFALVAIAAILLAQDVLTMIRDGAKLHQRAPAVDHVLGVISASGRYEQSW